MSLKTGRPIENVCRICLSSDNPKELIAPCICRGTVKYVHTTCLAQWRYRLVANGREEEIDSCTICKFKYVFKRKTNWGCILGTKEDSTILFTPTTTSAATPNHPFYPPICNRRSLKPQLQEQVVVSDYLLFPQIMTAQFWFDFLCKPEVHHLHLGLFFLGSLNNVFTAYAMMSDVYDMMVTENPRRKIKQVVLIYTSLFVACFWFHYNISAFRVASTQEFLQELPFWVLRWITVSMAIVDFGLRRIYWELDRLEFDDAEVISVQELKKH
ncbi:638_t:CDS:2 [Ambispora gerdemannii]|uniref:638_t:CDS:1 n=1 Tax=Ambispora gerdemannii TaxID=144530 RepID=A0A9N8Z5P7_9GLOM|nr:638_t:CDS:2 [Ambispora gerdemannii]